jgi:hypothetical protein
VSDGREKEWTCLASGERMGAKKAGGGEVWPSSVVEMGTLEDLRKGGLYK